MIEMKSLTDFHNPRVVRPDGTHNVTVGDVFATDLLHAKDLVVGKLAVAVNPEDLDREETDLVQPHPSISAPGLEAINTGRSKRASEAENGRLREITGRLERLRDEHETLVGAHESLRGERDKLMAHAADLTRQLEAKAATGDGGKAGSGKASS